jgi:DNA polymerase-3 subunit delta
LGSDELTALNTTLLDGADVGLAELKGVCDTIPFMTQRRLVVVNGLLARLRGGRSRGKQSAQQKADLAELADYLPRLPDTTRLVFVETEQLPDSHPILKLARQDERGYVRAFVPPQDIVRWIRQRATDKGGRLAPQAAVALSQAVGTDQRLLDQEIEKLLAFARYERPVTSDDVALLVPQVQEASVFDMVDALGRRDGAAAARLLHHLLDEGQHALYLFSMIVRQFRLLIQIKELAEQGLDQGAVAKALKLHPYPAGKLYVQARNFTLEQLETVHRHLLQIDVSIKTGQMQDEVALDLLVAGLAPPPALSGKAR